MVFRTLGFLLLILTQSNAQEWTRFRGPNGAGQSETHIATTWDQDDYKWRVDVPGIGHSSPVIWNDKLFVQSATEEGTQLVLCLNANTGATIWTKEFASDSYHIHARNSFASSSPTVDEDSVYVSFATPAKISLYALSHDGEVQWKQEDLGPFASQHGFGTSPALFGDLLVLTNLQMPQKNGDTSLSSVMAFDKSTGDPVWTTPRVSGKSSYSVPCLRATPNGKELLLCSTTHGVFGLELESGKPSWSVQDAFTMRTVSSPIIVGDTVFGSTGSGGGGNYVVAIDLATKQIRYKVKQQAPYVPTPVAHGELVFLWSDKGMVRCIDAGSGDTHWQKRVGGNYSGSPVRAGNHIYCIAENGDVVVLEAAAEYKLMGKIPLGEDSRSTPAIANGKMFLRTYSQLFCIGT